MARLLVAAQFGLIAAMLILVRDGRPSVLAVALVGAGALLGLAAIAVNRPGHFNIRPEPKPGARLATGGPYRRIRHPMYSALLLAGAGLVVATPGAAIVFAWLALAAVLTAKALREERGLLAIEPGYADYARRTRRFIPYLL